MYPALAALLKHAPSRPFTFVDIGAHHGLFSIAFAKAGAKVYAVEPYGLNVEELQKNAKEAGIDVSVFQVALSDTDGSAPLYHGGPSTVHSLVPGMAAQLFPGLQAGVEAPVTVQTMRWGTFCKTAGLEKLDILKIDAKWHDLPVLRTVVEDGPHPNVMMIESRPAEREEITRLAAQIGLKQVETIGLDATRDFHDAIFVRES